MKTLHCFTGSRGSPHGKKSAPYDRILIAALAYADCPQRATIGNIARAAKTSKEEASSALYRLQLQGKL